MDREGGDLECTYEGCMVNQARAVNLWHIMHARSKGRRESLAHNARSEQGTARGTHLSGALLHGIHRILEVLGYGNIDRDPLRDP